MSIIRHLPALLINGSASDPSANRQLLEFLSGLLEPPFVCHLYNELKTLPPFDPSLSTANTPAAVLELREKIEKAALVIFCSPEYIFSIPSGLKNALEWCVSTTIFTNKPAALITASAHGQKGHDELQLLLKTLGARLIPEATLLIQGVRGKINNDGQITDDSTRKAIDALAAHLKKTFTESEKKSAE